MWRHERDHTEFWKEIQCPGSKRWYPQHKARLIEDVLDGKIPLEIAMTEHGFSEAEFSALLTKFGKGGYSALRQTKKRSTPSRRRAYGVSRAMLCPKRGGGCMSWTYSISAPRHHFSFTSVMNSPP